MNNASMLSLAAALLISAPAFAQDATQLTTIALGGNAVVVGLDADGCDPSRWNITVAGRIAGPRRSQRLFHVDGRDVLMRFLLDNADPTSRSAALSCAPTPINAPGEITPALDDAIAGQCVPRESMCTARAAAILFTRVQSDLGAGETAVAISAALESRVTSALDSAFRSALETSLGCGTIGWAERPIGNFQYSCPGGTHVGSLPAYPWGSPPGYCCYYGGSCMGCGAAASLHCNGNGIRSGSFFPL